MPVKLGDDENVERLIPMKVFGGSARKSSVLVFDVVVDIAEVGCTRCK